MSDNSSRQPGNVVAYHNKGKREGQRKFNFSRSKLPLVIIAFLMLYITFSLGSRFDQLYAMQRDLQSIQSEIKELRGENSGLQEKVEKLQSEAYIEQVAREKLGLVKQGEARIVPITPNSGNTSSDIPVSELKD